MNSTIEIEHRTSNSQIYMLGGTGLWGRLLAIAVDFLSKRRSLFQKYEPKRSKGSQTNVNKT
eukprot:2274592-Heterocapsa_arctica.AAC.1